MINGMHAIVFSPEAEKVRDFFADVIGLSSVDAGGGWLIFALPPAELAVHPADGESRHQLYLMCDDIGATLAELRARGVEVAQEVSDQRWGLVAAIRLPDGNTLIGCTLGNLVIEVDKEGKEVWRVTNDDLPGKPINDACGVQRLANGNTVVTSHHAGAGQVKLLEVTRDKKLVWTYTDARRGAKQADLCDDCAGNLPGHAVARRGRKPKAVAA